MLKVNDQNNIVIIGDRKGTSKYPFNLTINDFSKYDPSTSLPGFVKSNNKYLYIYLATCKLKSNNSELTFDLSKGFSVSITLTTSTEGHSSNINDIMFIGPTSGSDNKMPIFLSSCRTGSSVGYPTFPQNYDSVYKVYAVNEIHTFSATYDSSDPDNIITSFDNKNPETYPFSRRSGHLSTPYLMNKCTNSNIVLGNFVDRYYTRGSTIYSFTFNGFCNEKDGNFIIS